MRRLSPLTDHPRLAAWLGLSILLGLLIGLTSLGRPLAAVQYAGLMAVAVVTAAIAVGLIFGDEPDPPGGEGRG